MEDEQQQHIEDEAADEEAEEVAPSTNGSISDELRALRQRVVDDKDTLIDIPGYDGKLVAKYRKLEYPDVEAINRRVERLREKHHPNATLLGHCDFLSTSLVGIYLRKDPSKPQDLEPLTNGYPSIGDGEASWEDAAKVVLPDDAQLPADADRRHAVRAVFGNDLAIAPHHVELSMWMSSAWQEDDESFALFS